MTKGKELIKAYIDLAVINLKEDSVETYKSMIHKAHKSLLLFFSGTLVVFFINTDQLIALSGKGPIMWSIIFFTFSVLIQWIKYLPKQAVQGFKPVIQRFFKYIGEKVDEIETQGIKRADYIDALVEKLKETPVGLKLLTSIRKESSSSPEKKKQDLVQVIDEILYSQKSGSQIFSSTKNVSPSEKKPNIFEKTFEKILKDSKEFVWPIILYSTGMLIFIINLLITNWSVLFRWF